MFIVVEQHYQYGYKAKQSCVDKSFAVDQQFSVKSEYKIVSYHAVEYKSEQIAHKSDDAAYNGNFFIPFRKAFPPS